MVSVDEGEHHLLGPEHRRIRINHIKVLAVAVTLVGSVGSVAVAKVVQRQPEQHQPQLEEDPFHRSLLIEIRSLNRAIAGSVLLHTVIIMRQTFTIITFDPCHIRIRAIFSPKQQVSVNSIRHIKSYMNKMLFCFGLL